MVLDLVIPQLFIEEVTPLGAVVRLNAIDPIHPL